MWSEKDLELEKGGETQRRREIESKSFFKLRWLGDMNWIVDDSDSNHKEFEMEFEIWWPKQIQIKGRFD